ncbi:MAG TPA: threonine--tRNA ligase [Actinomycetota bacterium]|nr:threonine--tRNA ligase [Actinomycetota bacterium]
MPAVAVADGEKDGFALAKEASLNSAVIMIVDGRQRDLSFVPPADTEVELVASDDPLGREVIRHSTAHVLAQAVLTLYPDAKYAIGPPIEDGFYYDFEVAQPFTPEDLERIEAEMHRIVKENQRFTRAEVSKEEALELFADQPYKVEIIEGVAEGADALDQQGVDGEVLSVYRNRLPDGSAEPFVDLCRGPHLPSTSRVKAFKLLRSSGAYWRGDEKRPMLQRIYGTAWESKAALEDYLHRLEEAERRDHRRLGRELELYSWPEEVGQGLAVWHPKGAIVRKVLEDLAREMHLERGYQPVYTPHIGRANLWETSGHLGYFRENMFPAMVADEGEYFAKPMNCPFHALIYKSKTRSYRELPLRFSELGTVYRYERSGVIHGLLRARGFTQDDSHIFCRPDQIIDEMVGVVDFFRALYETVGMSPDEVHFSTKPDKAVGTDEQWAMAEEAIRQSLDAAGLEYKVAAGEGTFYGPKIDIHVRDAIRRLWQVCTIQVDFQTPDRFGLEFVDEHSARVRPVMIHRALFGSVERFMGILVEHFAGAFPTWLAPIQVALLPISDRHTGYARKLAADFKAAQLRVEVDDSDDTIGAKIRRHQLSKVPYMLVLGEREATDHTVSVRSRPGTETKDVAPAEFISVVTQEVQERRLELSY